MSATAAEQFANLVATAGSAPAKHQVSDSGREEPVDVADDASPRTVGIPSP
jgi:hypothetical protein